MVYIALLRGINVGGKNKVEMAKLKLTFEALGFENVKTFINSGNIIFTTASKDLTKLTSQIESAIAKDFGFAVPTVLRTAEEIAKLAAKIPKTWVNGKSDNMKCDVWFLWSDVNNAKSLDEFEVNSDIEDLRYVSDAGAIVWRIDFDKYNKSRIPKKFIGSPLYKQMTGRNINTVRKLNDLMQAV